MPRYVDEPVYGRPREAPRKDDSHARRGNDPRDLRDARDLRDMRDSRDVRDPRESRDSRDTRIARDPRDARITSDRDYRMDDAMDDVRMDPRMDARMDPRMDSRIDPRMDSRPEPRANVGTRVARVPEVVYRDTQTGQIYQDVPTRRTPYEDDFQDLNPRSRPILASAPAPGQPKPSYNEYFVPEEGIDREVIQRDICMWLGPDALCRRGEDKGRKGYYIKAYRALTSAMITSLQDATTKYLQEKANRRRQGRSERTVPPSQQTTAANEGLVSYSEISDIQNSSPYDDPMDDDDRAYTAPPRMGHELDPRDARAQVGARHGLPPASYNMADPGYPAQYSLGPTQVAQHNMQYEQRYAGNTTPPSAMRPPHAGFPPTGFPPSSFAPSGYPARTTQAAAPTMTASSYRDPGTDRMAQYQSDPRYRR